MVMRRVLAAVAVALLLFAVGLSVRSVHRNGVSCGSVMQPMTPVIKPRPGTNPNPCADAHTADRTIALVLVATAVTVLVVITTSRKRVGRV
jgi:hypothetical protein